ALIAAALQQGRLPQWNPFEFGGLPLLADVNYNVFHPLLALMHFLPLPWGFSLFVAANAVLGVYGALALVRALGASPAAAPVGAEQRWPRCSSFPPPRSWARPRAPAPASPSSTPPPSRSCPRACPACWCRSGRERRTRRARPRGWREARPSSSTRSTSARF